MTTFRPTLAEKVRKGEKTQTRRLIKPYERLVKIEGGTLPIIRIEIEKPNMPTRIKWETGRRYANQPGRGKLAISHFRVLDIWFEDVRGISEDDAKAEGFESRLEFLGTWMEINSKNCYRLTDGELDQYEQTPATRWGVYGGRGVGWLRKGDDEALAYLTTLSKSLFNSWALKFEVCP